VFEDVVSGAKADRPGLAAALDYLRDGDVLVVWRLDRLGRSLPHLIETVGSLEARGVGFRSLTEAIDTTTPGGRLIFHVFGALGQFERDLIRERTKAGLTAALRAGERAGAGRLSRPRSCSRRAGTSPMGSTSARPLLGSRWARRPCMPRCKRLRPVRPTPNTSRTKVRGD